MIVNGLRLAPKHISSTYNTACTFIKHMKYDKAELVEVEDMLKKPTHNESLRTVQNQLLLLRRVPEVSVEEAQEDVQGANEPTHH